MITRTSPVLRKRRLGRRLRQLRERARAARRKGWWHAYGSDELENQVHARLYRQERLRDEELPLGLTAIVGEAALRRPLGGPTVM